MSCCDHCMHMLQAYASIAATYGVLQLHCLMVICWRSEAGNKNARCWLQSYHCCLGRETSVKEYTLYDFLDPLSALQTVRKGAAAESRACPDCMSDMQNEEAHGIFVRALPADPLQPICLQGVLLRLAKPTRQVVPTICTEHFHASWPWSSLVVLARWPASTKAGRPAGRQYIQHQRLPPSILSTVRMAIQIEGYGDISLPANINRARSRLGVMVDYQLLVL